jgi:hypothetical protein
MIQQQAWLDLDLMVLSFFPVVEAVFWRAALSHNSRHIFVLLSVDCLFFDYRSVESLSFSLKSHEFCIWLFVGLCGRRICRSSAVCHPRSEFVGYYCRNSNRMIRHFGKFSFRAIVAVYCTVYCVAGSCAK